MILSLGFNLLKFNLLMCSAPVALCQQTSYNQISSLLNAGDSLRLREHVLDSARAFPHWLGASLLAGLIGFHCTLYAVETQIQRYSTVFWQPWWRCLAGNGAEGGRLRRGGVLLCCRASAVSDCRLPKEIREEVSVHGNYFESLSRRENPAMHEMKRVHRVLCLI